MRTRALRRRAFLRAYLGGGPGVAGKAGPAALAAGLARTRGYAGVAGHNMLKDPEVLRAIERHLDAADARTDRIVRELGLVAFSDLRDVASWDARGVRVTASRLLGDGAAAAVQEVEQRDTAEGRHVRVRLHDKLGALALLAKIRHLLVERRELSGPGGGPVPVEGSVTFYLPANPRPRGALALPQGNGGGPGEEDG